MNAKEFLTKALASKSAGLGQLVELPVSVVRDALTDKTPGKCESQLVFLSAVGKLQPTDKVFQSADDWLIILGEM